MLVDEILSAVEPMLVGRRLPAGFLTGRRALETLSTGVDEVEVSETRERELQELRQLVAKLQEDLETYRQLLEDEKRQNVRLTDQWVTSLLSSGEGSGSPELKVELEPQNVGAAVDLARERGLRVQIPDEALRDIERLNTGRDARADGREVWKGLVAFHCYAVSQDGGKKYNGFVHWCRDPGSSHVWPTSSKKLSMNESKSVKRKLRERQARECPISEEVAPSGKMTMYPHLKISTHTQNAPRVYFYDDTTGTTGKIHVGFIGPHDLMPNTTTD
jgi:hypothetical protein